MSEDIYTDLAWVENGEVLAKNELLRSEWPSIDLLNFFPLLKLSYWQRERTLPPDRAFTTQLQALADHPTLECPRLELPDVKLTDKSRAAYIFQVLQQVPFRDWVLKAQRSPDSLADDYWSQAKCGAGEDIQLQDALVRVQEFIVQAIIGAYLEVDDFRFLCARLRIIQCRLISKNQKEEDLLWKAPLPADFTFLNQLVKLPPEILARALTRPCRDLARQISYEDLTKSTETSKRLAHLFNSLAERSREILQSRLDELLEKLRQALIHLKNYHLAAALSSILGKSNDCHVKDQTCAENGAFPDFAACRHHLLKVKERQGAEEQRLFILEIIDTTSIFGTQRTDTDFDVAEKYARGSSSISLSPQGSSHSSTEVRQLSKKPSKASFGNWFNRRNKVTE